MMTEYFDPNPPPTTMREENKYRTLKADFGDQYTQRAPDGINNSITSVPLSWANLTLDEATYIDQFFKARQGSEAFYYEVPDELEPEVRKWICEEHSLERVAHDVFGISATLRRVYDP